MSLYTTVGRGHIDDLPDPSAIYYRQLRICWDAATQDILVVCLKKADDSYAWFEVGVTEI